MLILLIVLSFIVTFLSIDILTSRDISLNEILVRAVLIFSSILVAITEFLSFFRAINFQNIVGFWGFFLLLSLVYLFVHRKKFSGFLHDTKCTLSHTYSHFARWEKMLLFPCIILLILVLIQGFIYPSNTGDSMTYHLPRVVNWISQQSLEHYQAYTIRQIYQPPFAEIVILHFNILSIGDYFVNLVQFLFLLFSLSLVILITEWFKLSRSLKTTAVFLVLTIPQILLQASATQNDIVIGFFILSSVYFAIQSLEKCTFLYYVFFGISVGLSIFTKGTAYIFLAPILMIFAIVFCRRLVQKKDLTSVRFALIAALIFLSINAGHYTRNFILTKNILGIDSEESRLYVNEKMNPALLISNILKNAGSQIGPYPLNRISTKVINKLHELTGVPVNSPQTNFLKSKYHGSQDVPNFDDRAPSTMHFLLILATLCIIAYHICLRKLRDPKILLYFLMICGQILLFCGYLKWQPFHTRLETPWFLLCVPMICYAISLKIRSKLLFYICIFILLFGAFFVVIFNRGRPYISIKMFYGNHRTVITESRYRKYFALIGPNLYKDFENVTEHIRLSGCMDVGLLLQGNGDMEYGIFSQFYARGIHPIYLNTPKNITTNIYREITNIDCVISRQKNTASVVFQGKTFLNKTPHNHNAWFYE